VCKCPPQTQSRPLSRAGDPRRRATAPSLTHTYLDHIPQKNHRAKHGGDNAGGSSGGGDGDGDGDGGAAAAAAKAARRREKKKRQSLRRKEILGSGGGDGGGGGGAKDDESARGPPPVERASEAPAPTSPSPRPAAAAAVAALASPPPAAAAAAAARLSSSPPPPPAAPSFGERRLAVCFLHGHDKQTNESAAAVAAVASSPPQPDDAAAAAGAAAAVAAAATEPAALPSAPAPSPLLGLAPVSHEVASRAVPGKGEDKWLLAPQNVFALLVEEGGGGGDGDGDEGGAAGDGDGGRPSVPPASCAFSAYGIFDGHGGKAASAFAARHLLPHVARAAERCSALSLPTPPTPDNGAAAGAAAASAAQNGGGGGAGTDDGEHDADQSGAATAAAWRAQDALAAALPWALREGFASADAECRRRHPSSGTTATLALQAGFVLAVGSVGDSHAFLDTGKEVVQMSGNHRLEDSPSERARVLAEGGESLFLHRFLFFGSSCSSLPAEKPGPSLSLGPCRPPLHPLFRTVRSKRPLIHNPQCELSCQKRCQTGPRRRPLVVISPGGRPSAPLSFLTPPLPCWLAPTLILFLVLSLSVHPQSSSSISQTTGPP